MVWTLDNTSLKPGGKSVKQLFSYTFPSPEDFLPGDPKNIDTKELEIKKQESSSAASTSISRSEIISRAESYANHSFYVSSSNITSTSGYYCSGKTVITPVTSSGYYTGIPYKWGGFTGLTGVTSYTDYCGYFYDEGLDAGKYAGDKDTTTTFGVCCAVGVDCSGFVSQTWGLSDKKSTATLRDISSKLQSKEDLSKGDVLIMLKDPDYGNHVRLFVRRETDGKYTVYEASARDWKTSIYSYTASQLNGYESYRYNNLSGCVYCSDYSYYRSHSPIYHGG